MNNTQNKIVTLSQLPEYTSFDFTDFSSENTKRFLSGYIESSINVNPDSISSEKMYTSNKINVKNFIDNIFNKINEDYGLLSSENNSLNVKEIQQQVNDLENGETTISGTQHFQNAPIVDNNNIQITDNTLIPYKIIKDEIKNSFSDSPGFAKPNSELSSYQTINNSPVINDNNFYTSVITQRTGTTFSQSDSFTISQDGILFMYGWATSKKDISPADAWVALEMKVRKPSSTETDWAIIQLFPWIIGSSSSSLQYFSFSTTVKKNIELRVTTGFTVVSDASSFQNSSHSLIYNKTNKVTYAPNTVIGYVI